MPDIAILTAIFASYDSLKAVVPQDGFEVDWVLVTDDPSIPDGHCGWRVVREPRPGQHPNRAAKAAKLRPWEYTGAPASIWIDASYRIISTAFARDALALADPVAQFTHPWRDCLYQEVDASLALRKYDGEPLREQAAAYREAGHPEHWGLWSAGALARHHCPQMKALAEAWGAEIDQWSFQDQVSLPQVYRNLGLRPAALPGDHLANPWLRYEGSGRH